VRPTTRGRAGTALGLALLTACGGGPTGPAGPVVRVQVIQGAGQEGLEGLPLPEPVVLRVTDGDGAPLVDVPVAVAAEERSGSVSLRSTRTDARGELTVDWTLGPAISPEQGLDVVVQGAVLRISATSIPIDEGDVILVRGVAGPLRGVVLARRSDQGLEVLDRHPGPDTVRILLRRRQGTEEVIVFPSANAVGWSRITWTPEPDTMVVELRPLVPVDVTVRVHVEPFDQVRSQALQELALADSAWAASGMGIRLGQVEFVDRTGGQRIVATADTVCAVPALERTEMSYVHDVEGEPDGLGCPPGQAFLVADAFGRAPALVAHQIGHTFTLQHAPQGTMAVPATEFSFSDGEIFRAHFDARSGLNVLFDAQPEAARRDCSSPQACLGQDFTLGR